MDLTNYEMIYRLEKQIPRLPKWAREERCEYCEGAKANAAPAGRLRSGGSQPLKADTHTAKRAGGLKSNTVMPRRRKAGHAF